MTYFALSAFGVFVALFVKANWNFTRQYFIITITLLLGLFIYYACTLFLISEGSTTKGGQSFLTEIPWFQISLYFAMILGMIAKYFFDIFDKGKTTKITIQKLQLIKPLLVSPVVFGVVYASTNEATSDFSLLIIAFQNGFFWQTLLAKPN